MKIDQTGCARIVLLTKRYAFKFPAIYNSTARLSWKSFLQGLLANMQEVAFSRSGWKELCPILFHLPGGFLVVMPRVELLSDDEFLSVDIERFCDTGNYVVPAEHKANSFGWHKGNIVAIDYGN